MTGISQRQVLDALGRVEALRKPFLGGFTYDFGWNDALTAAREAIIAALTEEDAAPFDGPLVVNKAYRLVDVEEDE